MQCVSCDQCCCLQCMYSRTDTVLLPSSNCMGCIKICLADSCAIAGATSTGAADCRSGLGTPGQRCRGWCCSSATDRGLSRLPGTHELLCFLAILQLTEPFICHAEPGCMYPSSIFCGEGRRPLLQTFPDGSCKLGMLPSETTVPSRMASAASCGIDQEFPSSPIAQTSSLTPGLISSLLPPALFNSTMRVQHSHDPVQPNQQCSTATCPCDSPIAIKDCVPSVIHLLIGRLHHSRKGHVAALCPCLITGISHHSCDEECKQEAPLCLHATHHCI